MPRATLTPLEGGPGKKPGGERKDSWPADRRRPSLLGYALHGSSSELETVEDY